MSKAVFWAGFFFSSANKAFSAIMLAFASESEEIEPDLLGINLIALEEVPSLVSRFSSAAVAIIFLHINKVIHFYFIFRFVWQKNG